MNFLSYFLQCFRRALKTRDASIAQLQTTLISICGEDDVGFPGDFTYAKWSQPYNRDESVAVSPFAIVRPENAQEVAKIVKYAATHGFKVQAKSGGHSYA